MKEDKPILVGFLAEKPEIETLQARLPLYDLGDAADTSNQLGKLARWLTDATASTAEVRNVLQRIVKQTSGRHREEIDDLITRVTESSLLT